MEHSKLDWATWILVLVGGLNWGLVGFFNWNLVGALLGAWPMAERAVYALVGLSALYGVWGLYKMGNKKKR